MAWRRFRIRGDEHPSLLRALRAGGLGAGELTAMGNEALLDGLFVSVGGSREAEGWDATAIEALAGTLAAEGTCIVSGGAEGTDVAAHRGALESGRATIVVPPIPLEEIDLRRWRPGMMRVWDPDRTLFLSLFPRGARVTRSNPIVRNRLVAGLADAAVAGRTAIKSGTNHFISECLAAKTPLYVLDTKPQDAELRAALATLAKSGATLFAREEALDAPLARRIVRAARDNRRRRDDEDSAQLTLLERAERWMHRQ